MILTAIKKYIYLILTFIILFCSALFLFIEEKKETIYLLYKEKPINCYNVNEHDKEKYYIFCRGQSSIFFNKKKEGKKIVDLDKINIITEKLLFERFKGYDNNGKDINFFIIQKITQKNKIEAIPVEKIVFWY